MRKEGSEVERAEAVEWKLEARSRPESSGSTESKKSAWGRGIRGKELSKK
jgi:hypothetical protein